MTNLLSEQILEVADSIVHPYSEHDEMAESWAAGLRTIAASLKDRDREVEALQERDDMKGNLIMKLRKIVGVPNNETGLVYHAEIMKQDLQQVTAELEALKKELADAYKDIDREEQWAKQVTADRDALLEKIEELHKRLLTFSERTDWGYSVGTSDEATDEFYAIVHSMP